MRYLVTGGAGFIGSALVRRLVSDGHEVTVLARAWPPPRRLHGVACDILAGDVRDSAAVARAAAGADRVVHLAYAQRSHRSGYNAREVLDVAVRGTAAVLDACAAAGVRDLLLASSPEAFLDARGIIPETVPLTVADPLDPRCAYGAGKIAAEAMGAAAQAAGLLDRLVIARMFSVLGPDMGLEHVVPEFAVRMGELHRGQPEGVLDFPVRGTGAETRAFCFIDDCVSQLILLLDHAGEGIWNAGSMEEHSVREVAGAVAACYGREIRVISEGPRYGGPARRLPDTARIEALGWDPAGAVSFGEAISRTAGWYRAHA